MQELIPPSDSCGASVTRGGGNGEHVSVRGTYHVECYDTDGNLKWSDVAHNLVTDVGAKLMLDTILAGSAFTASTYMGLKGTGAAAVGDTQASHAGWLEVGSANAPAYTSPRKTVAWNAASGTGAGSRSKAPSASQSFAITSSGTVAGCFININGSSAIDNTTGTLFSAGDFSGGGKAVASSDTITVTYTLSI